jgi:alpha-N-arabinofuranosidase
MNSTSSLQPRILPAACLFVCLALLASRAGAVEPPMRHLETGTNAASATLRVQADKPLPYRIPPLITGKFAEHLRENIYNGMLAQILRNPTLADYPFATREMSPDGIVEFYSKRDDLLRALREAGRGWGWPNSELDGLANAYSDGLAAFWTRQGPSEDVRPSPDTGLYGGRAQRVEVKAAGEGIAQWTYLPLRRARAYTFDLFARSPDGAELSVSLTPAGTDTPAATALVQGLSTRWQKFEGALKVDPALPADTVYKLAVTANRPGQFVLQHFFLQPADNIDGADPDIVRLLQQSHLPLLRWPGGNFVSSYHWQDGIGPVEKRPTKPNYAWGAVEPNLFGTDEFIQFCRAVGCEPMICVNAGSGTPQEAAQWVEYCNGPATSPMGQLRAANGHSAPYNVKYWEIGNELWGGWQFYWTTAAGYVDRCKQFVPALLEKDPGLRLLACGAPVLWGKSWNDTLLAGAGSELRSITDHPLIGGNLAPQTDPLDVYRDFMSVPEILEGKWAALRDDMLAAGMKEPRLAITELQLFAHLGPNAAPNQPVRLTPENLPKQASISEAIYDILIYHAAIRLSPFVELITHSAIVNHGGGLRKERERVFANPCYYAQSDFTVFANATPVPVDISSSTLTAPLVLGDLKNVTPQPTYSAVDALAALATNGDVLLSIVNRDLRNIHLTAELAGFNSAASATLRTLRGNSPSDANTLENPEAITPKNSTVAIHEGKFECDLAPFSIAQLRVPARGH